MMSLIAVIEDSFDLELQPDDIVEFTSYQKGIELLKKYNVILWLYLLVGLCIFLLLYQENLRLISIREKLFVGYIEIFVCCTCCFASHKNSLDWVYSSNNQSSCSVFFHYFWIFFISGRRAEFATNKTKFCKSRDDSFMEQCSLCAF